MFETLRERLLSVQQDLTSGLKTLGDKSREAKISKQRTVQYLPKFSAGLELLSRYEDTWVALHKGAKECAKAGELVDSEVVMLSAHWEKKRSSLIELQEQLQQVPGFLADLESMTANLAQLEINLKEMENHLLHLEDLCGQCELERYKHMQALQLENYKKTKRKELETFKAELDAEHAQKVLDMEHTQQMKLKERQKFFEEAFQQDMEQYLSTGYLQIAERREPIGSMSSMEVNVDMLEQMDLMDMSDQEALDVFLNSGEDDSILSPILGPESKTGQNEISLQVPSQSELRQKLSSSSSTWTDSASQGTSEVESPVIQSDEEEVQVDTALAAVNTERKGTSDVSDESDSQTV
ncbi:dysbindin isoform X1 [Trachemys scripta elegans]|uniref:dysbindin isoform X1 n=2 Tax=Trachemys scripta elegans TaxID=31138 RepID=UPI00155189C7|nr:dysbindin isoform X1 [Trachemys scripta elegans]